MSQLYKIIKADFISRGFKYWPGLNIDTKPFDALECGYGLYFADEKQIINWLDYGDYVAFVSVPPDAKVCHFMDKSKADMIYIDKIIHMSAWEMWQSYEFCKAAVNNSKSAIRYVKEQTEELCQAAVRNNPKALEYIYNQSEKLCIDAVAMNPWVLEHVRQQTPKICLAAVEKDGDVLELVCSQTPEICMVAVQQNGFALRHVMEQTEDICLEAMKVSPGAFNYVANITDNITALKNTQLKQAIKAHNSMYNNDDWYDAFYDNDEEAVY